MPKIDLKNRREFICVISPEHVNVFFAEAKKLGIKFKVLRHISLERSPIVISHECYYLKIIATNESEVEAARKALDNLQVKYM